MAARNISNGLLPNSNHTHVPSPLRDISYISPSRIPYNSRDNSPAPSIRINAPFIPSSSRRVLLQNKQNNATPNPPLTAPPRMVNGSSKSPTSSFFNSKHFANNHPHVHNSEASFSRPLSVNFPPPSPLTLSDALNNIKYTTTTPASISPPSIVVPTTRVPLASSGVDPVVPTVAAGDPNQPQTAQTLAFVQSWNTQLYTDLWNLEGNIKEARSEHKIEAEKASMAHMIVSVACFIFSNGSTILGFFVSGGYSNLRAVSWIVGGISVAIVSIYTGSLKQKLAESHRVASNRYDSLQRRLDLWFGQNQTPTSKEVREFVPKFIQDYEEVLYNSPEIPNSIPEQKALLRRIRNKYKIFSIKEDTDRGRFCSWITSWFTKRTHYSENDSLQIPITPAASVKSDPPNQGTTGSIGSSSDRARPIIIDMPNSPPMKIISPTGDAMDRRMRERRQVNTMGFEHQGFTRD